MAGQFFVIVQDMMAMAEQVVDPAEHASVEVAEESAPSSAAVVEDKEELRGEVRRYLRKIYLDLVGPTILDDEGNSGAAVLRDHDTAWPEFIPIKDKEPSAILEF